MSVEPETVSSYQETTDPYTERRAALNSRLEDVKAQSNKLLDLYQINDMPIDSISARLKILETEREKIQKQLDSIPKIYINRRREFEENLARCHDVFENTPLEEQRMYVASLVRKVIVNEDGTVEIKWRF